MMWSQICDPGGGPVTKLNQISAPFVAVTHLDARFKAPLLQRDAS